MSVSRPRRGKPATRLVAAAVLVGTAMVAVTGARRVLREAPCGPGFVRVAARCCASGSAGAGGCAIGAPRACPPPLVPTARGCDAPERDVVEVPATEVTIGPSDWEAQGRVAARVVRAGPFLLDRLELSVGRLHCPSCPLPDPSRYDANDPARAASDVTLEQARAACRARGGRLPTEDEWIVAAAGDRPRRYPWGDTGAVCRRAAWGLVRGPCAEGSDGPDTVGAHPEGATPLGVHDLAGNVAEWVEAESGAVVRGGSFETDLATELRTWVRREVTPGARDRTIGFRCAYDVALR